MVSLEKFYQNSGLHLFCCLFRTACRSPRRCTKYLLPVGLLCCGSRCRRAGLCRWASREAVACPTQVVNPRLSAIHPNLCGLGDIELACPLKPHLNPYCTWTGVCLYTVKQVPRRCCTGDSQQCFFSPQGKLVACVLRSLPSVVSLQLRVRTNLLSQSFFSIFSKSLKNSPQSHK